MEIKNRTPKVDSKAAACTDSDDQLRAAMQGPRPAGGKSAPASVPAKPTRKSADLETPEEAISLKGQLTAKEHKFIETYLLGEMNMVQALESSGYTGYSPSYTWKLGKKIIQKYEHGAGDHKKIFRAVGAGELAVAQGLLSLAKTAKSEMVRLNAWATIAKCLGLQKDTIDIATGISIVVNTGTPAPTGLGPDGGRPALIPQEQHKLVPRAISITK
jgi:hypothetical protein